MKNPIFSVLTPAAKKKLKKEKMPAWIPPMLAVLSKKHFDDPKWIYEPKFDGMRLLIYKDGKKIHLYSRNQIDAKHSYSTIAAAIAKQKADSFIIDGEAVAFKGKVPSFEKLIDRRSLINPEKTDKKATICIYIFDILYVDGYLVTHLPLHERKKLLNKALTYSDVIRYTKHIEEEGLEMFDKACNLGWEGVMAKDFNASYVSKRSRAWLKFKCVAGQELVIGGYTLPRRSRTDFGALLVGYYKNGKLIYAGKVGTGYDQQTLTELGSKMRKLKRASCPFESDVDLPTRDVQWISPKLVGEFGFQEWTQYGKLRQGRFKGLRADKKAKDVVKEIPK